MNGGPTRRELLRRRPWLVRSVCPALLTALISCAPPGERPASADPAGENADDGTSDVAAITVSSDPLKVTESGSSQRIEVVLRAQPTDEVLIDIVSDDSTEGRVSPAELTFTAEDWSETKVVTLIGVDDDVDDGDVDYAVLVTPTSSDERYGAIDVPSLAATTTDDDGIGVEIVPLEGVTVTEAGGHDSISVTLTSRPSAEVEVHVASTKVDEATVSVDTLRFDPDAWSVPQTITVTGLDDPFADGDQQFAVEISFTSSDEAYAELPATKIGAINIDDDVAGVVLEPSVGLEVHELGTSVTVDVSLTSEPIAELTLLVSTDDSSEGLVSPEELSFTPSTWQMPQLLTITGVPEGGLDGDVSFHVVIDGDEGPTAYANKSLVKLPVTTRDLQVAPIATAASAGDSPDAPTISGDGNLVIYSSMIDSSATGDTNGRADLVVVDRGAGTTRALSDALVAADARAENPDISADGSSVVFESRATNLAVGPDDASSQIYLANVITGELELISVGADGRPAAGDSFAPAVSADGRYVVFESTATNLVGEVMGATKQIFRRDRTLESTAFISKGIGVGFVVGNGESSSARVSGDGRFVTFSSAATNLIDFDTNGVRDVFIYDALEESMLRVTDKEYFDRDSLEPDISADGEYVAFRTATKVFLLGDSVDTDDVFLWQREDGWFFMASMGPNYGIGTTVPSDGPSRRPRVSADGRFVSYVTAMSNRLYADTNELDDIYVFDRVAHDIVRIGVASDGSELDAHSRASAISADGSTVVFLSAATNLSPLSSSNVDVCAVRVESAFWQVPH